MDWLTTFLEQAFNDYNLMFVDILTYRGINSHQINGNRAYITVEKSADEILKEIDNLGLFVEYTALHQWTVSYQC